VINTIDQYRWSLDVQAHDEGAGEGDIASDMICTCKPRLQRRPAG
jgi:hypothetical protein